MVKTARTATMGHACDKRAGVADLRQGGAGFGRVRRIVAVLATLCLGICAQLAASAAEAADLTGGYFGLGAARGMRIEITQGAEDAAPEGLFTDSNGLEAKIGGDWVAGGLETVLAFPKRQVFLRIMDAPAGLAVVALPLSEEGAPLEDQARELAFLRDGMAPPAQPELFMQEPTRADRVLDPDVFLASYPFWSPTGVSRGFEAIGARYRTMMRLYPLVHADVLWKLCRADGRLASRQRGEALRGQGVSCDELEGLVAGLQRGGGFGAWKADVGAETEHFLAAVQCARGYIVKKSVCGPAAKRTAKAAVSLRTVASAIAPYR